jgi:hypothetical protein
MELPTGLLLRGNSYRSSCRCCWLTTRNVIIVGCRDPTGLSVLRCDPTNLGVLRQDPIDSGVLQQDPTSLGVLRRVPTVLCVFR